MKENNNLKLNINRYRVLLESSPTDELRECSTTPRSSTENIAHNLKEMDIDQNNNSSSDISNKSTENSDNETTEIEEKKEIHRFLWMKFDRPLKWKNIFIISAWHLWYIHSFYYYWTHDKHWLTTVWLFTYAYITGVGVTGGAHRLWSHKAYKAKLPLRIILMVTYTGAGMNSIFNWVRDHRVHHKFSDTEADPHNASRGFFYSHCGWLLIQKSKECYEKGKQIDMSDIKNDPVIQFQERHFSKMKNFFCFLLPTVVPIIFWKEKFYMALISQCALRYLSVINMIWAVNSAAHLYGTRPYDKRIYPVQNLFVAFWGLGEGWHNYHHTFPWDYKAAELGSYVMNFTTMILHMYQKLGWAYDCKEPTPEMIKNTYKKYGDGSYNGPLYEVPDPYEFKEQSKKIS